MTRCLVISILSIYLMGSGNADDPTPDADILVPEDASTIQQAIDMAELGDVILIAPGTYSESLVLKSNIELRGSGADVTNLTSNAGPAMLLDNVGKIKISGFRIEAPQAAAIVISDRSDDITVAFNHFENANKGIELNRARSIIVGNTFTQFNASDSVGVSCVNGARPTISSNLFIEVPFGIIVADNANPIIINNTLVDGETAVLINDDEHAQASEPWILNNIVAGHGQAFAATNRGEPESMSHNILWENDTNYWGLIESETDLFVDPQFSNPSKLNFKLKARSPAVDRGFGGEMAPEWDHAENPRLSDGDGNGSFQIDIGAYEYLPPSSTERASVPPRNTSSRDARGGGCNGLASHQLWSILLLILPFVRYQRRRNNA